MDILPCVSASSGSAAYLQFEVVEFRNQNRDRVRELKLEHEIEQLDHLYLRPLRKMLARDIKGIHKSMTTDLLAHYESVSAAKKSELAGLSPYSDEPAESDNFRYSRL